MTVKTAGQIFGAMRTTIDDATVVPMCEVPDPPLSENKGKWNLAYKRIAELKTGTALKVTVNREKGGYYARSVLRKKARAAKRFLSSSHSADGLTWYFWLEPVER